MKAGLRLTIAALAAGLTLAPGPLLAQTTNETTTNAPASNAIGPRELQNFDLQGTVTRPAETTAEPRSAVPPPSTTSEPGRTTTARVRDQGPETAAPSPTRSAPREPMPAATTAAPVTTERTPAPAPLGGRPSLSSITVDLPPVRARTAPPAVTPADFPTDDDAAIAAMTPEQGPAFWPWLLAAMMLGAGGAYLFWRRNHREAFAGGPQVSAFVVPEPAPLPPRSPPIKAPPAAPPVTAPPQPSGIVATRLRPWIDVEFEPDRCIVDDELVVFEFELDLYNSGSAMASDVRVAIEMFNASPTQDADLAAFFADPAHNANAVPDVAPFKRFELRPQIAVQRDRLRVLEAGGRRLFVPLIAINLVYHWGKGQGQSAAAFLLGRENGGEKLAPFRIDLGARTYRRLGARILPGNIRR